MKREIKFRAFLNSKYYAKPRMLSWEELLEQHNEIDMFQIDLMTLMQYTGLHDKNGHDIYEDDIVRVAGVTDPGMKWVVTWSNASWELHHVLGGKYMTPMRLGTMSVPIEVVGNIWENPKLLEAEK